VVVIECAVVVASVMVVCCGRGRGRGRRRYNEWCAGRYEYVLIFFDPSTSDLREQDRPTLLVGYMIDSPSLGSS
jgi:hypothetical protein